MNKKLILLSLGFFLLGVGGVIGFSLLSGRTERGKFSSCVVLEEEFCDKGEKVDYEGRFYGLGFDLPQGTKVYAPFAGQYSTSIGNLGEESYEGVGVYYTPGGKLSQDSIGFFSLVFPESKIAKATVEKGEVIFEIGTRELSAFGQYNLILFFERYNPKSSLMEMDLDLFKQFFQI